jgi:adenine-specific DNA-methyltransferase
MAKIDITRTELVWPGKYDDQGRRREVERVHLPFQIIETINETRATREAQKKPQQMGLFDVWQAKEGDTFEEGWKNKLIWGDNKYIMSSLLDRFAGKIDLIYIDPPFATGADFNFTTTIGEDGLDVTKEQSIIEEKAYRDTWGQGIHSYLQMMYDRLTLMRELLHERASIHVHLDWHLGDYVRVLMDELFGRQGFRNQIVWYYPHMTAAKKHLGRKHDVLLWYSKSDDYTFNVDELREPYDEQTIKRYQKPVVFPGGYEARMHEKGKLPDDVWRIPPIRNVSQEKLDYDNQKPRALLERIVQGFSNEGDLVADFFCGSGTTLEVAEDCGRRWIGADLSRYAIHVTRKRLLDIQDCQPFEVLNLGKYERRYWQTVTFARDGKKTDQEMTLFEYLAFILRLYGAQPLPGMQHLHGTKGSAPVHIGAVDAPVTIEEINACLDECTAIGQKELHVLGWEWEMGLYDIITDAAKGRGIKLLLLNIPREVMEQQAVDKGDIHFFELAYLELEIKQAEGRKVAVALKDFVIPSTELIPPEVRDKVKKWSDYIDYWAVDWDFQNDTFMNGWVTYRTRRNRTLALESDPHAYELPGNYTIMVKVIDIFGIDTSQAFEVEVK